LVDYKYSISINLNRSAAVKHLNDCILAGRKKGYSDFLINISNTQTYSNVCAPVAGILDYYRNEGAAFEIVYVSSFSYVKHTEFDCPKNVEDFIDKFDLQYPFDKVWKFHSSEAVCSLVDAYILAIRKSDIISSGVVSSLEWCLNETMDNILQHSNVGEGYIMAQLHKSLQQFSVCVFDTGIGIYNSLRSSKHKPANPLDAITLALQEKVTRSEEIGQGNGLWGLSNLVSEGQGRIAISSSGAVYRRDRDNFVQTVEGGHFHLGKAHGTTLVDFQLNYSRDINVAKALNGYEPDDLWLENFEAENGDIVIPVAEVSNGTGTRKSAEKLRTMILNITLADKKKVVLDFTGVNLLSSSFADELIGKIIAQYGFVFFIDHFSLKRLSPFNIILLNRSVQQRMAQMYYDSTIKDADD
jgi:hypothetical protein